MESKPHAWRLTPLGDPPLFLGYLCGVPFSWTFTLWPEWLASTLALLTTYYFLDRRASRREGVVLAADALQKPLIKCGCQEKGCRVAGDHGRTDRPPNA